MRNAYNNLVGRSERNTPHGRILHRWGNNTGMGLREVGWEDVDWIHLARDRDQWRILVNIVTNLRVP
jgi:hypothetical protein